MLSRRELSETQIRRRLATKGFGPDDVESAVARLKEERAIDDARVAGAIARTQTSVKGRGKLRVRQELMRAGISSSVAKEALADAFDDLDADALLEAAIRKRLRGTADLADDRTFQRMYRYLVAQGFEHDHVMRALNRRRRSESSG